MRLTSHLYTPGEMAWNLPKTSTSWSKSISVAKNLSSTSHSVGTCRRVVGSVIQCILPNHAFGLAYAML